MAVDPTGAGSDAFGNAVSIPQPAQVRDSGDEAKRCGLLMHKPEWLIRRAPQLELCRFRLRAVIKIDWLNQQSLRRPCSLGGQMERQIGLKQSLLG